MPSVQKSSRLSNLAIAWNVHSAYKGLKRCIHVPDICECHLLVDSDLKLRLNVKRTQFQGGLVGPQLFIPTLLPALASPIPRSEGSLKCARNGVHTWLLISVRIFPQLNWTPLFGSGSRFGFCTSADDPVKEKRKSTFTFIYETGLAAATHFNPTSGVAEVIRRSGKRSWRANHQLFLDVRTSFWAPTDRAIRTAVLPHLDYVVSMSPAHNPCT
ncbi:hypothetical protein CISG_00782 [Coccidioides immitis RMSCC 3703]|uniref:Uncharacterized protein n=2 Tax=Coccidioides immitis TaxID=5501 RepID=A0A0J8TMD3_COCIT|nr:hypothetical protein CIRG_03563 [Coccidioides immitis RMSCC 2394]KMU74852.1 hypothetical protein CISG_00782 [Coccidioides immitis RMSCC 3703]